MIGQGNPRLPIILLEPADDFKKDQQIVIALGEGEHVRVLLECAELVGSVWNMLGLVTAVNIPDYSATWAEESYQEKVLIIVGTYGWLRLT